MLVKISAVLNLMWLDNDAMLSNLPTELFYKHEVLLNVKTLLYPNVASNVAALEKSKK